MFLPRDAAVDVERIPAILRFHLTENHISAGCIHKSREIGLEGQAVLGFCRDQLRSFGLALHIHLPKRAAELSGRGKDTCDGMKYGQIGVFERILPFDRGLARLR